MSKLFQRSEPTGEHLGYQGPAIDFETHSVIYDRFTREVDSATDGVTRGVQSQYRDITDEGAPVMPVMPEMITDIPVYAEPIVEGPVSPITAPAAIAEVRSDREIAAQQAQEAAALQRVREARG